MEKFSVVFHLVYEVNSHGKKFVYCWSGTFGKMLGFFVKNTYLGNKTDCAYHFNRNLSVFLDLGLNFWP